MFTHNILNHQASTASINPNFEFTVNTANTSTGSSAANTFTWPTVGGTPNLYINWGDGNEGAATTIGDMTHTYSSSGTYNIVFSSIVSLGTWRFNNTGDKLKITQVTNWGDIDINGSGSSNEFYGCSNLVNNATDGAPATFSGNIAGCFRDCSSLGGMDLGNVLNPGAFTSSAQLFFNASGNILVPSTFMTSSLSNMSAMFRGNSSITTMDVTGWDLSGATNLSQLFYQCTNLSSIDGTVFDSATPTSINGMFRECAFSSIDVTGWNLTSCTDIAQLFYVVTELTSIDVSFWNTSAVTSMQQTFRQCTGLTSLNISNWSLAGNPTFLQFVFNCSSLASINCGTSGAIFNGSTNTDYTQAFEGCALNQSTVDDILVGIDGAGTSNGTLDLDGGTNSTPSSTGLTAKSNLEGRGWTVTVN